MEKGKYLSFKWKLLIGLTLIFTVVLAFFLYWSYNFSNELAMERITEDLVNTLLAASAGVDGDELQALYSENVTKRADNFTDDMRFWDGVEWLHKVKKLEPRSSGVYSYIKGSKENEIIFITSTSAMDDPPWGEFNMSWICDNPGPNYEGIKRTTLQNDEPLGCPYGEPGCKLVPYTDDWGTWVSAFTPVYNSSGTPIAGLGIDFSADYLNTVREKIIKSILITFGTIFLLILVIIIILSDRVTTPITSLTETVRKISQGDYNARINIDSNDEIGDLAYNFNIMAHEIQMTQLTLIKYQKELENKVDLRTKELRKKVNELIIKEEELQKTNEKVNEANSKLKEIDKNKDEFISIAAHELKTPLTSIKGFAQLLQKEKIMSDKKQRIHYLHLINTNTIRLYELILDIVDSSRISLGKLNMTIEEIDIYPLFKEIQENMGLMIKQKGITPVFSIQKNLPKLKADPERTLQIIRNLIVNAIHFTEKGEISLKISKQNNYVQFEVSDTGEGIPKDKQKFIFSKFYQADQSLTRKVKGSGLGLSVSKGLVELMHGKIWFKSVEGKGTTFYFTLPLSTR